MKISNFKFLLIAVFAISLSFASCGRTAKDAKTTEGTEQVGAEYTSAYVCPMHCEGSGSAEAGKCPVCKMDYVANEDHKGDGHKH
jgi:hypothetical protein